LNNPVSVNCPQNTWTKVATAVQNICIWRSDKSPAAYLMTYRISGSAAPTSQLEGQPLFIDKYFERIQSAFSLDVYIMAIGENGAVRVDEFLFLPDLDDLTRDRRRV